MIDQPLLTLNNGVQIPQLGLGVYQSPAGDETEMAVRTAIELGYRHIDTAKIYRNEQSVGVGLRASGVSRSDIFVTTKLWNEDQGYDSTMAACNESLEKLGLDTIDLYLIHWPVENRRLESWQAMERLYEEGKCRAIGVSNFMVHHLEDLLAQAKVVPAVNQIEISPYIYRYRQELVDYCRAHDILIEAYSPLTKARKLDDPKLVALADRYGKSAAQILIRWAIQQEMVVLPKSTNPERIRQNGDVFDFEISGEDMAYLETFNENLVTGWDPTYVP